MRRGNQLRNTYNSISGNVWYNIKIDGQPLIIDNTIDLKGIKSLKTPGINNVIAKGYDLSTIINIRGSLFGGNVRFNNKNINLALPSFVNFDKEVGVLYGVVNGQKRIIGLVNGDTYDNLDFKTTDLQAGHTFVDVYTKGQAYVPFLYESVRNSLTINKEMTVQNEANYFCILHRGITNHFAYYSNLTDFNIIGGHSMQELEVKESLIFPGFKTFTNQGRSLFGGLKYSGNDKIDLSSITSFDGDFFGRYAGTIHLYNSSFTLSNNIEYISKAFNAIYLGDDLEINTTKKLVLNNGPFHHFAYIDNLKQITKANTLTIRSAVGVEYNDIISRYFGLQQLVLDGKFTATDSASYFPFNGMRLIQIISKNNTGSNFKPFISTLDWVTRINELIVINDTTQTFDWTTIGIKPENIYTGQLVENGNLKYVIQNNEAYLYGYNQKALTPNVDVPESINGKPVTKVLNGAFMNAVNLETVSFPKTIKTFGSKLFKDTRKLKAINIDSSVNPNAISDIDEEFFGGAMETLNIPENVKSFSVNSILNSKNNLQSIKGPNTLANRIHNNAVVANDTNYIILGSSSTIIGWSIKGIDKKAFKHNPISKLDFRLHPGKDLEVIGDEAFKNSGLTNVVFKVIVNGVEQYLNIKEIGTEAFMDAAFLKTEITIEIPASVTYIGARAFASTNSLGKLVKQNDVRIRLLGGMTQAQGFHPEWNVSVPESHIIYG